MPNEACRLIDAFPAFVTFYERASGLGVDELLDRWANEYLAPWPELRRIQIEDYATQGLDWREVAEAHAAPLWPAHLADMEIAHERLLSRIEPVCARARQVLGYTRPLTVVIHVGIGCGAGWATSYAGTDAILLGLENIAAEGWLAPETLEGLLAHELTHLWHTQTRQQAGLPGGGVLWQLFAEGLAVHGEQAICGRAGCHLTGGDWPACYAQRRASLARAYLSCVAAGERPTAFFGSWYDIQGVRYAGYYLGAEAVAALCSERGLAATAQLPDCDEVLGPTMARLAADQ